MNRHQKPSGDNNTPVAPVTPGYLDLVESARYAGNVSQRTVARWLHEGLPSIQVRNRGRRLIRLADLDAFLCGRRQVLNKDLNRLVDSTMQDLGLGKP